MHMFPEYPTTKKKVSFISYPLRDIPWYSPSYKAYGALVNSDVCSTSWHGVRHVCKVPLFSAAQTWMQGYRMLVLLSYFLFLPLLLKQARSHLVSTMPCSMVILGDNLLHLK